MRMLVSETLEKHHEDVGIRDSRSTMRMLVSDTL